MTTLKNDLILRAARGEQVERAPVWAMRQAGRYLPEFRELRSKYDFFTMCRTPELAAEVTLQPLVRFPLDAVIIFSDILVVPQALGMTVEMLHGKGPHFPSPLVTPDDCARLKEIVNVDESLGYVFDAIRLVVKRLDSHCPVIGFCGGPWTLMAYMVEGGGSKAFSKAKAWLYLYPDESKKLLQRLAEVSVDYLVGQVEAGAQMLQVFESWAGELSPDLFNTFCLPHLEYIVQSVKTRLRAMGRDPVPMTVFAKGAHFALDSLSRSGYDVVSIDWTIDPVKAIKETGGRVTLQGNLDPCALYASEETLRRVTTEMIGRFGGGRQRYIANLGHGMHPDHTPEKLAIFVDTVREISSQEGGK